MTAARKRAAFSISLAAILAASLWLSLLVGAVRTSPADLGGFLFRNDQTFRTIFLDLRLCRALTAFLVGASLSLSGAILQGYFQNPMADPFVVGVSSGASFGAVLCLSLGLGTVGALGFSLQSVFAFGIGFALVSFVYLLSRTQAVFKVETLLLTGIAAGAVASSLTSFLLFLKSDSFEQAVFWLLGSFTLADWRQAGMVAPYLAVGLLIAQWLAKDMNLLVLGDETAKSLGSPTGRVRLVFLAVATLLAAISVSVSGVIGFVGLVVPHWTRLIIGPDHRYLFGLSALSGGTFLVLCDLLARTVLAPTELPIGIITALFGAPFFIYLLHRRK
jgi:iron complex transport system permease protein